MAVLDDPEEALHLVEAVETGEFSPPRLVVLDLNLPKFGGLELLQFMRERERWKPVPIVIMSTSSAQRDSIEAQRLSQALVHIVEAVRQLFLIGDLPVNMLQRSSHRLDLQDSVGNPFTFRRCQFHSVVEEWP